MKLMGVGVNDSSNAYPYCNENFYYKIDNRFCKYYKKNSRSHHIVWIYCVYISYGLLLVGGKCIFLKPCEVSSHDIFVCLIFVVWTCFTAFLLLTSLSLGSRAQEKYSFDSCCRFFLSKMRCPCLFLTRMWPLYMRLEMAVETALFESPVFLTKNCCDIQSQRL